MNRAPLGLAMLRPARQPQRAPDVRGGVAAEQALHRLAAAAPLTVFQQVAGSPRGLTEREAAERLARVGANQPEAAAAPGVAARFRLAVSSPFVVLLAGLGCVFAVLGDARGWVTVSAMVLASVGLRWWQQVRSDRAIRGLRSRVTVTVTVRRRAEERRRPVEREIPVDDVVPGDVLRLGAGDIVPADARVLTAQRLIVDQSVLSGEQLAVVKEPPAGRPAPQRRAVREVVDLPSICFAGTSVVSGSGTAVVIATGPATYFGGWPRARPVPGHAAPSRTGSARWGGR